MTTTLNQTECVISDTNFNFIECHLSHLSENSDVSDKINVFDEYIGKYFNDQLKTIRKGSYDARFKPLARRYYRDLFNKANLENNSELIHELWLLVIYLNHELSITRFIVAAKVLLGESGIVV